MISMTFFKENVSIDEENDAMISLSKFLNIFLELELLFLMILV